MHEEDKDHRQGEVLRDGDSTSAVAAAYVPRHAQLTEVNLQGEGVYKGHRIHVSPLASGTWLAAAVHLGARDSGFEPVKGEYPTKDAAVLATKRQIDAEQPARPARAGATP